MGILGILVQMSSVKYRHGRNTAFTSRGSSIWKCSRRGGLHPRRGRVSGTAEPSIQANVPSVSGGLFGFTKHCSWHCGSQKQEERHGCTRTVDILLRGWGWPDQNWGSKNIILLKGKCTEAKLKNAHKWAVPAYVDTMLPGSGGRPRMLACDLSLYLLYGMMSCLMIYFILTFPT